jgi:alginate O-acetyltransferase complex protein AlgI
MVLCGFWHGAAWTFVIWGLLHAAGSVLTRELEATRFYNEKTPRWVKQAATFAFVAFAWIFFRAASLRDACTIVSRLFTASWSDPLFPLLALAMIAAVWAYQFLCESRARRVLDLAAVRVGLAILMLAYLLAFAGAGEQPFIYLQF